MKTASRILGSALFREGFQVQDAPRYGAERRGAPLFAYVRAARDVIKERGIISRPDLVIVADNSLMSIPAAGVCQGLSADTVLLVLSRDAAEDWAHRLNLAGPVVVMPPLHEAEDPVDMPYVSAAMAGAAARLLGVVSRDSLVAAVQDELGSMSASVRDENFATALRAWDQVASHAGIVAEGGPAGASPLTSPQWVETLFEEASVAAPVIHDQLTSVEVRTGLWRTMRPVIDHDRCNRCWWVCSTFCPDSAIEVDDRNLPRIDYDHCKGCMICVVKCPPHAISAVPEHTAADEEVAS